MEVPVERPSCAECSSEDTQTVEIGVFGVILLKDLCTGHLGELLQSARRIPRTPAPAESSDRLG